MSVYSILLREYRELKYTVNYNFYSTPTIHSYFSIYRTYCLIYKLHEIINKYGSKHNFIYFIQNIILTLSTTVYINNT